MVVKVYISGMSGNKEVKPFLWLNGQAFFLLFYLFSLHNSKSRVASYKLQWIGIYLCESFYQRLSRIMIHRNTDFIIFPIRSFSLTFPHRSPIIATFSNQKLPNMVKNKCFHSLEGCCCFRFGDFFEILSYSKLHTIINVEYGYICLSAAYLCGFLLQK